MLVLVRCSSQKCGRTLTRPAMRLEIDLAAAGWTLEGGHRHCRRCARHHARDLEPASTSARATAKESA